MDATVRPELGRPTYESIAKAPLTPADFAYDQNYWDQAPSAVVVWIESLVEKAIESADVDALDVVNVMVEQLDAIDGDIDLEPCPAGDDGLHYFICGGQEGWGYGADESDSPTPVYGDDQSEGPLNSVGQPYQAFEAQSWRG